MKTVNSMYSLLGKGIMGLGVVALLVTASCQQNAEEPTSLDQASIEADAIAEADFDEVDEITDNIMGYSDGSLGGRVAENDVDERVACATITHDKDAKTITIDFGDGCTGPYGVTRSGIIFITYTGARFIPGSTWTVTFQDFYIDGRHIEGTRTVENVSESLDDNPKFHVVLEGGKVTWPDETFATREVDRYRVWIRAANPINDEMHILEGSTADGVNRRGVTYSTTVLSDLIYKRACRGMNKARIPVQGTKEVILDGVSYIIDFGDGECDSIITISSEGRTITVDLSQQ